MGRFTKERQLLSEELAALTRQVDQEQRRNALLRCRLAHVTSHLEVLDQEQAAYLRRSMAKLSRPVPLLPSGHPLDQQSAGPVCVWGLPDPGSWDPAFEERVRALSTRDMVLLHRNFMEEVALLLPKAQMHGAGSSAQNRLQHLMDSYFTFKQNAIMLAPVAWAERAKYNLDTLQPCEAPKRAELKRILDSWQKNEPVKLCWLEYAATCRRLQPEYLSLARRYRELMGQGADCRPRPSAAGGWPARPTWDALAASQGWHGGGGGGGGGAAPQTGSLVALQEVMERMQTNLWRRKLALKQCLHAVWQLLRGVGCTHVARSYLVMYPSPLDAADFMDMIVDAGIRAVAPAASSSGCSLTELPAEEV